MKHPRTLLSTSLALPLALAPAAAVLTAPAAARAASDVVISGVARNLKTGERIEGALVVLQCACLQGQREALTGAEGLYRFAGLPPGLYTIQIFYGEASSTQALDASPGDQPRVNFSIDPGTGEGRTIEVDPVRNDGAAVTRMKPAEIRKTGVGGLDNNFTGVLSSAPLVGSDAGGPRVNNAPSAETRYLVDGANATSPTFGSLGASIVQEFIDEVEVVEGVFDAESGGASGGLVKARRIGGSNKLRGQVVLRATPRLASPRFIDATDEALRVAEVMDYEAQGVLTLSGPLVQDKLFFAIGLAPGGARNSLIQSFYRRRDKDRSGGYEDCPYENGTNDCAANANHIDTVRFAEQKFRTGRFQLQWTASLDWMVTPKHRLRLSGGGGPAFRRRSFRQPPGSEPNAFGSNPNQTLGGASRVASGVVNDSFGLDYGDGLNVGLDYEGRVAQDKIEIDAGIYYSRFTTTEAWKLDDPTLKSTPMVQERDSQGRNLFELLDKVDARGLAPGVESACNDTGLPGMPCPTRVWLSGGIGSYSASVSDRIGGALSLTHFLGGRRGGAHQLKYGAELEGVRFKQSSAFSGSNSAGFYGDCPAGQVDGGEYCFDPVTRAYTLSTATMVDNHRAVLVDSDNPDSRTTIGYGRVRYEQEDLRAIATPIGAGARVASYDSTLRTQNYGIYLQDKWSILSNLYLNAGVRWELQEMKDALGRRGLFIYDNVAPRVSLVYDWTDEGKSRLYASYGWFYTQLPTLLGARAFGGLVDVTRSYRASDCALPVLIGGDAQAREKDGLPTEHCTDFNQRTSGLTAGAVVPRLKGMYVQRFNVGYEHEVVEDLLVGVRWQHDSLGRGVEDVSTNGGQDFLIANPGESVSQSDIARQEQRCSELQGELDALASDDPNEAALRRESLRCDFLLGAYRKVGSLYPRPIRNTDSWVLSVTKRFARGWMLQASYVYMRAIGNYDGFVERNTGAINLGASTTYDIPELVRNSYGPLWDNRPHQLKIDGFYMFDLRSAGRLTLGASLRYQSGSPMSVFADNNRYPGQSLVYVLPRGAGGRLEPNYYANLSISYAYPLPKELELEVTARLVNVTNSRAVLRVDETYSFSQSRAIAGGDLDDLKHAKIQSPSNPTAFFRPEIVQPQGNYGVKTQFQQPIAAQFELRLRF